MVGKPYILKFPLFTMAKRRLKAHKQRGMNRRLKTNKGPMSAEEKLARKKNAELQKELNKKKLAKEAKK